jgi:hypothetical protein
VFPNPIIEYMYKGGCEWSHPEFIGYMGVEYNQQGEVTTFRGVLGGAGAMRGRGNSRESWRITGVNGRWVTEEIGCQTQKSELMHEFH